MKPLEKQVEDVAGMGCCELCNAQGAPHAGWGYWAGCPHCDRMLWICPAHGGQPEADRRGVQHVRLLHHGKLQKRARR